jgi:hypothetical protein
MVVLHVRAKNGLEFERCSLVMETMQKSYRPKRRLGAWRGTAAQ